MNNRSVTFSFKHFSIDDTHCGMKIGTDGVLAGAWTECRNVKTAVDIGCGCGIISLMLAQRGVAKIKAIEIDSDAAEDARTNVDCSPWGDRIDILNMDFCQSEFDEPFDLIVSNPPFFGEGEHSPLESRALARHEGSLNYSTLISFARKNLDTNGLLSFIYPYGYEDEIIYIAEMSHLKLRRICHVRQRSDRPFIRTLFEFSRTDGPIIRQTLTIKNKDGCYSKDYIALTKNFYLCF